MTAAVIRELARNWITWTTIVFLPIAAVFQFAGARSPIAIALSLTFIAACGVLVMRTLYVEARDQVAERRRVIAAANAEWLHDHETRRARHRRTA